MHNYIQVDPLPAAMKNLVSMPMQEVEELDNYFLKEEFSGLDLNISGISSLKDFERYSVKHFSIF
jgi:hypothetical protein